MAQAARPELVEGSLLAVVSAQTNCTSNVTFTVTYILTNPPPPIITTSNALISTQVVYQCGAPPPSTNTWALLIPGGSGQALAVVADSNGNSFVTGFVAGSPFVARYSATGVLVWQDTFTGTGAGNAVARDRIGNVFVTGYFTTTAGFGTNIFTSYGGQDLFLVKLSGVDGSVLWAKHVASVHSTGNDVGQSLATDPNNGDVVLTGTFTGYEDFIGNGLYVGPGGSFPQSFVARYTREGVYLWAKVFVAGSQTTTVPGVAVDSLGNTFVAGNVSASISIAGTNLAFIGTPGGGNINAWWAKFSSSGTFAYARIFGESAGYGFNGGVNIGQNAGAGLALDGVGDVLITGTYIGPMDLGNGVSTTSTPGRVTTYLASFNAGNGLANSVLSFQTTGSSEGTAVAVDASNNVFLTGSYYGTLTIGTNSLIANAGGAWDIYLAKISPTGLPLWAKSFGGPGSDVGFGVAVEASGAPLLTGYTQGGSFAGTNLNTSGAVSPFIMKLAP